VRFAAASPRPARHRPALALATSPQDRRLSDACRPAHAPDGARV